MNAKQVRANAELNYVRSLKNRVGLLKLQRDELALVLEISELERRHQLEFPELYQRANKPTSEGEILTEGGEDGGIAETENQVDSKES